MKRMILVVLGVIICFCAACQATPETPLVVGKDQEKMIEQAKSGLEAEDSENPTPVAVAPETYSYDNTKGKLTVRANANVIVPELSMPITRVQGVDFTQAQVDLFWKALIGETKMFEYPKEMSKSEIEEKLIMQRQWLETAKKKGDQLDIKMTEKAISKYEKQYKTAPDVVVIKEGNCVLKQELLTDWQDNVLGEYTATSANQDVKKLTGKNFYVRNNYFEPLAGKPAYKDATMDYYNDYQIYQFLEDEKGVVVSPNTDKPQVAGLSLTSAAAAEIAEKLIADTNSPFQIGEIKLVKNEDKKYAYLITCQRIVNGVACVSMEGDSEFVQNDDIKRWTYESYKIVVADEGILSFKWISPLEIGNTEVSSSNLMPFDKITAIFEKMMTVKYEPLSKSDEITEVVIEIDKINLELMRIPEQNSIENGLLIPVWRFYGNLERFFDDGTSSQTTPNCYLTLNAVDGSVIDEKKGY